MDAETEQYVTAICNLGCDHVRDVMQKLSSGQRTPELGNADTAQCAAVLHELQAIMSVYDGKQKHRPC